MKTEDRNEIFFEILDTLPAEQQEQAKKCMNLKELLALAGTYGVELPDETLDAASGGCDDEPAYTCIACGCPIEYYVWSRNQGFCERHSPWNT